MTDNEIIKALECLMHDNCEECPYYRDDCVDRIKDPIELSKYTLDLINRLQVQLADERAKIEICAETISRQDAEIERLQNAFNEEKSENDRLSLNISNLEYDYELLCLERQVTKAEVIKEFVN